MCCIFTCCGWVLDLVQRLWTFTMACCISTAVCCAIVIASMSGIALGYNYSLAEYIDLKETNVSVYLKRGVFDDEIADDMEWRRSGPHQNLAGHLGDNHGNMITPDSNDEMAMRRSGAGRKLDDSIFQSDDHHRFEGSLIKLTQKPLFSTTVPTTSAVDLVMATGEAKAPLGSLNQLKEIQAMINRRKMESLQSSTERGDPTPSTLYYEKDPYALANWPNPAPMGVDGRRMMITPEPPYNYKGSARDVVPPIISPQIWANPHLPPDKRITLPPDQGQPPDPRLPGPVKLMRGPLRPYTVPESMLRTGYEIKYPPPPPTTTTSPPQRFPLDVLPEEMTDMPDIGVIDSSIERDFKDKKPGGIIEEYEDDIKGLPVRKRRHLIQTPRNLLDPIISNTPEADGRVESSKNSIRYKVTEGIYTNPLLQIVLKSHDDVLFGQIEKNKSERDGIGISNDIGMYVLSADNFNNAEGHKALYKLVNEKHYVAQQPTELKGSEHSSNKVLEPHEWFTQDKTPRQAIAGNLK